MRQGPARRLVFHPAPHPHQGGARNFDVQHGHNHASAFELLDTLTTNHAAQRNYRLAEHRSPRHAQHRTPTRDHLVKSYADGYTTSRRDSKCLVSMR